MKERAKTFLGEEKKRAQQLAKSTCLLIGPTPSQTVGQPFPVL
jgi:hypothetical protein